MAKTLRKSQYQLEKVKKVLKDSLCCIEQFHLFGKLTRDMTKIEIVKIILLIYDVYDGVFNFSIVCYFPPHNKNNKKQPVNFRKS